MFFEQFNKLCEEIDTTPTRFVTDILHLSSSKVTAWKNGSIPKYEILIAIANYFSVSVGSLFDGESNNINLTEIENQLLLDFKSLSSQGQDYIKQQMFIAKEIYKKQDVSQADLNVG